MGGNGLQRNRLKKKFSQKQGSLKVEGHSHNCYNRHSKRKIEGMSFERKEAGTWSVFLIPKAAAGRMSIT